MIFLMPKIPKKLFSITKLLFSLSLWKILQLDLIYKNIKTIIQLFKKIFFITAPQTSNKNNNNFTKSYNKYIKTPEILESKKQSFALLALLHLTISVIFFLYGVSFGFTTNNIGSSILCISISFLALTFAFRYHFWLFQLNNKKLGCSLKEWLNNKIETDNTTDEQYNKEPTT